MIEQSPLSRSEQILIAMDTDRYAGNLLTLSVLLSGIGTGIGAGELSHQVIFSGHGQYDQTKHSVQKLQQEATTVKSAQQILRPSLDAPSRQAVTKQLGELKTKIAIEKTHYPHSYNPNADTAITVMGGITVGVATVFALGTTAFRRANEAHKHARSLKKAAQAEA